MSSPAGFLWVCAAMIAIGIVCDRRKLTHYAWPCATLGTMGLVVAAGADCSQPEHAVRLVVGECRPTRRSAMTSAWAWVS